MSIVAALRKGGLVMLFRHGLTDVHPLRDRKPVDLTRCDGQRRLSPAGRYVSTEIGKLIGKLGIPVGAVLASPYCRTMRSGQLMFSKASADAALAAGRSIDPDVMRARLRRIIEQHAKKGANIALITHHTVADAVFGVRTDEGDVLVFKPTGNGFENLGVIPAARWGDLYRTARRP